MGTSSIIEFVENKDNNYNTYIKIYQHFDGYPKYMGKNLIKFIKNKKKIKDFGFLICQYINTIKHIDNMSIVPLNSNIEVNYYYIITYYKETYKFTISIHSKNKPIYNFCKGYEMSIDFFDNELKKYNK
jgi:hypothetical protein